MVDERVPIYKIAVNYEPSCNYFFVISSLFCYGVFCDHGKEGFPQKEGSVTRVVFVVVVVVGLRYNRSLNIFFTLDSGER